MKPTIVITQDTHLLIEAKAKASGPMIAENFSITPNRPKNSPLLLAGARLENRLRERAWVPPCTTATSQARHQNSTTECRK